MGSTLALFFTLFLVAANAFFVASEFALLKVRPTRLAALSRKGSRRAASALAVAERLDLYLGAIQLGVTLASLALGWVGEPAVAQVLEPGLVQLFGAAGVATAHGVAAALALFGITFFHVLLGELVPKSLAIRASESIALWTAPPLRLFYRTTLPVIWLLNASARVVLRALGLGGVRSDDQGAQSLEELRLALQTSPTLSEPSIRELMVRVIDYRRRVARHVMIHRADVRVLDASLSIAENLRTALESGYSRYPVVEGGDRVLGFVHIRELFEVAQGARRATDLRTLIRPPVYIREDTPLENIRAQMQQHRTHLAVVTGADGALIGIVTLEDLLEEIVGEIQDEHDAEQPPLQRRPDGTLEVDGQLLLEDLARDGGVELPKLDAEVETVGGYVMAQLERLPRRGDRVDVEGYELIPIDIAERRVRRVRILPRPR